MKNIRIENSILSSLVVFKDIHFLNILFIPFEIKIVFQFLFYRWWQRKNIPGHVSLNKNVLNIHKEKYFNIFVELNEKSFFTPTIRGIVQKMYYEKNVLRDYFCYILKTTLASSFIVRTLIEKKLFQLKAFCR